MKRHFNTDILFFVGLAVLAAFCFYTIATAPPKPCGPPSDSNPAMEWYFNPANPAGPFCPTP